MAMDIIQATIINFLINPLLFFADEYLPLGIITTTI